MSIRVIGIGNAFRRDDGIGPAVIDRLKQKDLSDVDLRTCRSGPATLIDALRFSGQVVVVDALGPGHSPGQILRLDPEQITAGSVQNTSTHGFGLAEALSLLEALGHTSDNVLVLAVEGVDFGHGEGLSPAVAAALPKLLEEICSEIEGFNQSTPPKEVTPHA
ncbi:MAG: hydrogenase maturation protease [Henriciella sp.]|nr:hydrogenase maturation protease [Henriciella sp.]